MSDVRLAGATRLPDGVWVRGRGLRHPLADGAAPDYGLYLGGHGLRARHESSLTWPHDWVFWRDGLLPADWPATADRLLEAHARARAGQAVEFACHGGLGRTGTAIACLATLSGLSPRAAVRWTRENYHRSAVEVPWQRRYVSWFARHTAST
ncbi:protein tyrosine phosphatase [Saccharomonospora piscinae]|uniref:protein-tyrosine phosphatase family protein n=1 Tax=Saccharomonospora piscinae TaxID=687388 RepID=UPI0011063FC0|nr:protein tyrosine phosphatase [Saccharomonospora piscinae]TLW93271.1 protein tyrosine phosphatase [Saccharomonospora piscinae]